MCHEIYVKESSKIMQIFDACHSSPCQKKREILWENFSKEKLYQKKEKTPKPLLVHN